MKISQLSNCLLVSSPALQDNDFQRSVIYVFEHSTRGALGLMMNKPMTAKLDELFKHLDIEMTDQSIAEIPVLYGGPVSKDHGFVLYLQEPTEEEPIAKIELSASKELLTSIADNRGPKQFSLLLGYTGWGKGQLEEEISQGDWLVAPVDFDVLFSLPIERRWLHTGKLIGVDLTRLSLQTGRA